MRIWFAILNWLGSGYIRHRFLLKSILGFRFWTFFLSIFEKGKYFLIKNNGEIACEHKALKYNFQLKNL
jgi:hypothetical protein